MNHVRRSILLVGVALVVGALSAGCGHAVTAANAAPVMAENRAEMIKWHKEHDKPRVDLQPGQ